MNKGLLEASLAADRNARRRDIENGIDIDAIGREFSKARDKGLKIISYVDKNRVPFAQVIAPNMRYLVKNNYLATAEMAFLLSIAANIEMHSNAIICYEDSDKGQYLKVADMANLFNYSERQASRLVNGLINKGIIYEYVDTLTIKKYGRVVEERPLFLNPEIIYCGDKNKINATLCRLVINADHLEKGKLKLPWKLWLDSGCEYGRLYRRDTWLKKRKDTGKKTSK
jgi:hypothetical protein